MPETLGAERVGRADAARKRAAVELIAREGGELRRTARRYSLCEEDAEDAYQRALEILLLKAPEGSSRDLVRWTKTVLKHEALAVRRSRERLLGKAGGGSDPAELVPAEQEGPDERVASREELERSREALRGLKRAELRALALLAAGCSYAEISAITGYSRTKVNRCLAEGRERYRRRFAHSEGGGRCAEMAPLLSAFCDGEASPAEAEEVRQHLRACAGCRAALRAYRAAPAAAAALMPALPLSRSLLERGQELLGGLAARLPGFGGGGAEAGATQVAVAGGARGAGAAALAKLLAVCAGTVGGAAACVATGVVPAPLELAPARQAKPTVERVAEPIAAPEPTPAEPVAPATGEPDDPGTGEDERRDAAEGASVAPPPSAAGAVEYPSAAPPPPPPPPQPAPGQGSPAGEFGP